LAFGDGFAKAARVKDILRMDIGFPVSLEIW